MMITVLFLAANPSNTARIAVDREVRSVKERLRASSFAVEIQMEQEDAVRVDDLAAALLRHHPQIVHFTGHGNQAGALIVENDAGLAVPLDRDAVSALFAEFSNEVRCVMLNACYTEPQAQLIAVHIDCVLGVKQSITDDIAIRFATSFYQAIGFGRSVGGAFRIASAEAGLTGSVAGDLPQLVVRAGVDADAEVLVGAAPTALKETPKMVSMEVSVQGEGGQVVAGADVRVAGQSARTDAAGLATFVVPATEESQLVEVSAPGYAEWRLTVPIDGERSVNHTMVKLEAAEP